MHRRRIIIILLLNVLTPKALEPVLLFLLLGRIALPPLLCLLDQCIEIGNDPRARILYRRVRAQVPMLDHDRPLGPDIDRMERLLRCGSVAA